MIGDAIRRLVETTLTIDFDFVMLINAAI